MMYRVQTLMEKLQQQVKDKLPAGKLLITIRMLQAELMALDDAEGKKESNRFVSMDIAPAVMAPISQNEAQNEPEENPNQKTISVLEVDEAEVEAELDEIKKNVESRNKMSTQNRPAMLFDPVEDIPTLTHQQPAEVQEDLKEKPVKVKPKQEDEPEGDSLNDRLRQTRLELSDSLKDTAIKDLRKGIGVNDRFLFINELFRGDEVMYERSIKTINNFSIFPEAEYWIRRELKVKLAWNDKDPVVKQFDQLIKRRFSST